MCRPARQYCRRAAGISASSGIASCSGEPRREICSVIASVGTTYAPRATTRRATSAAAVSSHASNPKACSRPCTPDSRACSAVVSRRWAVTGTRMPSASRTTASTSAG